MAAGCSVPKITQASTRNGEFLLPIAPRPLLAYRACWSLGALPTTNVLCRASLCALVSRALFLPQFADIVHIQTLMGWGPAGTSVAVNPLSSCIPRVFRTLTSCSFACPGAWCRCLHLGRLSASSSVLPWSWYYICQLSLTPHIQRAPSIHDLCPCPVAWADDVEHPFCVFLRVPAVFHYCQMNRPSAPFRPAGTRPPEFRARTPRSSSTLMSRPPLLGVRALRYGMFVT